MPRRRSRASAAVAAAAALELVRPGSCLYDPVHHVESARIYGNIDSYAYYFMDLLIGIPPQRVSVIVDTGSGVTAFPCRSCPHCGKHIDPNFDFTRSETAKWTPCGGSQCSGSCSQGHCNYRQGYTEGSSISGWYFTDEVRLGDAMQRNPPVRVSMGCHQDENKLFFTQRANGIMGIRPPGRGKPTILDSLFADKAHIDTRVFSLCLATWGGQMTVGGFNASYHRGELQYVPMHTSGGYYNVPLSKMVLDGQTLHTKYGTAMIDSGTTYTYMGSAPYQALRNGIERHCMLHSCSATRIGSCWTAHDGISKFPSIEVWFGQVKTMWIPQAYLYRKGSTEKYCYAFENDGPGASTVLGASWMMWQDIIFDMRVNKVGIAQANCPNYQERPTFTGNEDISVPSATDPAVVARTNNSLVVTELPAKGLGDNVPWPAGSKDGDDDDDDGEGHNVMGYFFGFLCFGACAVLGVWVYMHNADAKESEAKETKLAAAKKKQQPTGTVVGVEAGEQEVRSDCSNEEEDPLVEVVNGGASSTAAAE